MERDRDQSRQRKRYKEIEVDRQEIETNIERYTNSRLGKKCRFERYIRGFGLTKRQKEISINKEKERVIKKQKCIDKRQKQICPVIQIIDWIKIIGLKDIYVNLDLQKDGRRQASISIEKEDKEIEVDGQEIETNVERYTNNRLGKKYRFERYIREFGLTKRQKEISINKDKERGIKKQRWLKRRQK